CQYGNIENGADGGIRQQVDRSRAHPAELFGDAFAGPRTDSGRRYGVDAGVMEAVECGVDEGQVPPRYIGNDIAELRGDLQIQPNFGAPRNGGGVQSVQN